MKKSILSFLAISMAVCFLAGCASTPKEKRSLKWQADSIPTLKKAKILAENYEMNDVHELPVSSNTSVFVAQNSDKDAVVFYFWEEKNKTELFSYVYTNGNGSSYYELINGDARYSIRNTDEQANYERTGYYLANDAYEKMTYSLCRNRNKIKKNIQKLVEIEFLEPVNFKQPY